MPLLARTVSHPAGHRGAARRVADLGALLADRRISAGGDVAIVVGPGQGERIAELVLPGAGTGPTCSTSWPAARSTPRRPSASGCAQR